MMNVMVALATIGVVVMAMIVLDDTCVNVATVDRHSGGLVDSFLIIVISPSAMLVPLQIITMLAMLAQWCLICSCGLSSIIRC